MHYKEVKGILSAHNGMNIFRGCTHGCIYCDSRSKCYQINHDFEDVEVKRNAPELLETALIKKRRKCMISTGAMCDPYIPLENELHHMYGIGLTLREGNREYFYQKLNEHFPGLSKKYHKKYGGSYEIKSDNSKNLLQIFYDECKKHGIVCDNNEIFHYMKTFPDNGNVEQISLF